MNTQQLVQGVEEATTDIKDLSGFELFLLCHTSLIKKASQEARRRLEAKGLKQTQYGWLTAKDIGELGIVFKDGLWSSCTASAFKMWIERLKRERDIAIAERINAVQASMKLAA